MSEWWKHFFILNRLNSIMKKTTNALETPVTTAKAEKSTTTKVTKKTTEIPIITEVAKTIPEASVTKEVTETTPEASVTSEVAKATPKKTSTKPKATKKAPVVEPKPIAASPETAMHERVGLTAGSIWHYLAENGATSVTKLVDALPEEEAIIQRSIGWLAQEDKILLSVVDQVETIALNG